MGALALRGRAAAEPVKRVGILAPGPLRPIDSFKARLKQLGWVEGETVRFEERWAEAEDNRYPALARELVALAPDAILTWSTPSVMAAKAATGKIPIVMAAIADPVAVGAVASLARPGGNITGFSTQNFELEEKRLEMLRELAPRTARLTMLGSAGNAYSTLAMQRVKPVVERSGLSFDGVVVGDTGIDGALQEVRRAHPDAVLVAAAPALYPYRQRLAEFMAANRLPAVYPYREFAEAGGLLAYSTNFDELFREAAGYVDKVLRGANPADMPVQQAATFELIVNTAAAKALGLDIPSGILARADEIIE